MAGYIERIRRGPHQGQPVRHAGVALSEARAAMILVHGRGATAESILELAAELEGGKGDGARASHGFAYLAPQAAAHSWYPNGFLAPLASNEPGLSSGLAVLAGLLDRLDGAGIPTNRIFLLGFSQGACLALEFVARHARRYGGVAGLSGGLIGPPGTPREYAGSLDGTPVFLGCGDMDSHIPAERVRHTAEVLSGLGGEVTERIYAGMGHIVNRDEIRAVRGMMANLLS